jgi:formamidopyrimidine-DNA glycosylase
VQADGELGYFQHRWRVYEKEGKPCPNGQGTVRRITRAAQHFLLSKVPAITI